MLARKQSIIIAGTAIALIIAVVISIFLLSDPKGGNTLNEQQKPLQADTNDFVTPIAAETETATGSSSMPESVPQPQDGALVKADQIGYGTEHTKIAVVEGDLPSGKTFTLIDMSSGNAVFTGSLSEPLADAASLRTVRRADFSPFQTAGQYQIFVDGAGSSYPFAIHNSPYKAALATMVRSYTLQRSGVAINDPVTGLKQKAGHLQDAKAEIFFDDGISHKGDIIDVSGGWYDAGDYGKYIPPAAVTVAQLLLAFELNPKAFPIGQLKLPEELESPDPSLPDLLAEVRYELEWMLRMQRQDGAVYHKVSGSTWTGFVTPDTDTQTRYVYGLSTYGIAQFAGATALASRIYKPFDQQFSDRLLAAAEQAQSYLSANESAAFRQDPMQDNGSGGYGKMTDAEERLWALAELFRATGNTSYSEKLIKQYGYLLEQSPQAVNWANTQLLGQWAYYSADKSDEQWRERIRTAVTSRAKELVQRIENDGYLNTLKAEEYTWASVKAGAAYGCLLLLANRMQPTEGYADAALEQLHHVFGRSATGYSYVTGVGSLFPKEPHHRINAATGITIPGLVVGGPNRYGGDPDLDAVKAELAPALAYLDARGSYSSNEYAIDYNAPVILLASFFADN
ncbi:glycoside hydrolase family 9 protein [Paenibacillus sp. PL91]|uniref:glycoside hydrolase family 9 protein n=1 Tax=Paenibacillus sp. PL91 TaxID=2729538 RepID=UPI001659580D|nr:glycoside hydrolase family 9 protein [Paenibacillus sp. PL91]